MQIKARLVGLLFPEYLAAYIENTQLRERITFLEKNYIPRETAALETGERLTQQEELFLNLLNAAPLTPKELREAARVSASRCSQVIRALKQKGHIRKVAGRITPTADKPKKKLHARAIT